MQKVINNLKFVNVLAFATTLIKLFQLFYINQLPLIIQKTYTNFFQLPPTSTNFYLLQQKKKIYQPQLTSTKLNQLLPFTNSYFPTKRTSP